MQHRNVFEAIIAGESDLTSYFRIVPTQAFSDMSSIDGNQGLVDCIDKSIGQRLDTDDINRIKRLLRAKLNEPYTPTPTSWHSKYIGNGMVATSELSSIVATYSLLTAGLTLPTLGFGLVAVAFGPIVIYSNDEYSWLGNEKDLEETMASSLSVHMRMFDSLKEKAIKNVDGMTPLHLAVCCGNLKALYWLLCHNANPYFDHRKYNELSEETNIFELCNRKLHRQIFAVLLQKSLLNNTMEVYLQRGCRYSRVILYRTAHINALFAANMDRRGLTTTLNQNEVSSINNLRQRALENLIDAEINNYIAKKPPQFKLSFANFNLSEQELLDAINRLIGTHQGHRKSHFCPHKNITQLDLRGNTITSCIIDKLKNLLKTNTRLSKIILYEEANPCLSAISLHTLKTYQQRIDLAVHDPKRTSLANFKFSFWCIQQVRRTASVASIKNLSDELLIKIAHHTQDELSEAETLNVM